MRIQILIAALLSASAAHATTTWSNSTISANVTDDDIIISGDNTLANNVSVTATSANVTITIASTASLTDNNNNYTLSLIATSTQHAITLNIGSQTLTIAGSLTFNIQEATTIAFTGGSLIVQNNAQILADPTP